MRKPRVFLASVGRRPLGYPFTSPPLGILYLAAYLRSKFPVELKVVNQRAEECTEDDLVRQIVEFESDAVGFSVMTTCSQALGELTRKVRRALPRALIVLGGPHVSSFEEEAIRDTEADAAVAGEGELALEAVLRARFDGQDFSHIPGLLWRTPDGRVVTNPGRLPAIDDLDSLPFPAYDLIDLSAYWKLHSLAPIARRKYISLISSRGCPYHCIWCHNIFGKRFRPHSSERIVEEMGYFTKKYGIKDVELLDDVFNLDHGRVIEVCEGIHRRNLRVKIALPNAVRTDILTQEVVDALVDAGWYFSGFALETGSPRLQELTGKRLSIPKFLEGVRMAVRKGVFAYGFAMLGHPTETEAELQQTIDTMVKSEAHLASFFTVIPFPKTRLYDMAMERMPERLRGVRYAGETYASIRVNLSDVPDEVLFAYQRKAYREFYLSPRRVLRIVRHYPKPLELPSYLPIFLRRATKGLLSRKGG